MLAIIVLLMASPVYAAKCKFGIEKPGHVESKMLLVFRGMTVGLQGYFGVKDGETYFRGRYASNYKARENFTEETPLELTLADGRTLSLEVISGDDADIQFGHLITVSREAQPVFTVAEAQWQALLESPIVALRLSFEVADGYRSRESKVKARHAAKIQAAMECVTAAAAGQL